MKEWMNNAKLFQNMTLKMASLAGAIIIWLIIMNINDPVVTRIIYDVPVNVVNTSYIESMGLSYKISDGYDTVAVTVRGNRSLVESLTSSRFNVTADLTQIISLETDPVMVPLTVYCPSISSENLTASPRNINIDIEEMVSKEFVINATASGTTPANGFEVGEMTVEPETVTIRGPGTLIDKIERVNAIVDVTGIRTDKDMEPVIRITDKNGEQITDTQMSYLSMNVTEEEMTVHVTVYAVRSGVSLKVETSGEPASGYTVGNIAVTPSTLSVVGSRSVLDMLEQNGNIITITADSGLVDVTDKVSDVSVKIDIRQILPEGLSLASQISTTAVVSVQILPANSRSVTVETRNIDISGLTDGRSCVFESSSLEIKIQGSPEILDGLSASDLRASVDLSGLMIGRQKVPVSVDLPDGCSLVEDVFVGVIISQLSD
jgi:YbbR domain-containing protein